jgi:NAD(P)-dependent dehydrogenase (short-subunit alcohol dehydrogenase family)
MLGGQGVIAMATSKIALVTGANKGLGFEICRQLAQQGFTVLLGARDEARGRAAASQLTREGLDVRFILLDMEKPSTFDVVCRFITGEFGHLDVLINNAGFAIDWEYKADAVPLAMIRQTFETNFFGLIDLTQRLLPVMRQSPTGRIVNQSSGLGSLTLHSTPNAGLEHFKAFAYNASKTVLNAFTVHLADALQGTSIKVNSAHPGDVKTDANPRGEMSVKDGAKTAVELALLSSDGPSGGFFHLGQQLPW